MRHAWSALMPELSTAPVHLVETSPVLRAAQKETLGDAAQPVWHDDADALVAATKAPLFGIANEFFDALPAAQLVWRDGGWHHRMVGLAEDRIGFVRGAAGRSRPAPTRKTAWWPSSPAGGCHDDLAGVVARRGGAVLIIDYGRNGNPGDSLQAVAAHQAVDIFTEPGTADLSHWVDFAALSRAASQAGARLVGPVPQGRFLMRIGLAARAEQAAAHAEAQERRALLAAIDRLTSPAQMGEVFKVALLVPDGAGLPPGFEAVAA